MSMFRVRSSCTYRRVDCAFPSEALTEMNAMLQSEIDKGVDFTIELSGPMMIDYQKASMVVSNWIIRIEEQHATRFILQMSEIAAKFPLVDETAFGDFGD